MFSTTKRLTIFFLLASAGLAERKFAMLVGNAAYPEIPLRNTVADAQDMSAVLSQMGFATRVVTNARKFDFERQFEAFLSQLQQGDVALFYYSGHGFQLEGENYLVPIDFAAGDPVEAKYQGYSANRVLERIERRGVRLNIMILDACRSNPFRGVRAADGGLATMAAGEGTYIAFATGPGRTASDNAASARNGLFTTHLLRALQEPGLSLDRIFTRAREDVARASSHQQIPWSNSSVIGDFYFQDPGRYQQIVPVYQPVSAPPAPSVPQDGRDDNGNIVLKGCEHPDGRLKNLAFASVTMGTAIAYRWHEGTFTLGPVVSFYDSRDHDWSAPRSEVQFVEVNNSDFKIKIRGKQEHYRCESSSDLNTVLSFLRGN